MDKRNYRFEVEFLDQAYQFLESLDPKTRTKVFENIRISRLKIDPRLLKKIDKEIWEFRTSFMSIQIRLFAFWDRDRKSLIICTHGFIKKSQKIPLKELQRAKIIRKKYFNKS